MELELTPRDDFWKKYGPWAVIAGGSEGVGASFARKIAAHGVKLFLIARKPEPLVAISKSITAEYQVEVRGAPLDLADAPDIEQVKILTQGLEVGLFIYNAGLDGGHGMFVDRPLNDAMHNIRLNVLGPTVLCHHFAAAMRQRSRGGIVLVGSLGGCAGGANLVAYSASKAYEQMLGEGLWYELKPFGVDVLSYVIGNTRTPAIARHGTRLEESGYFIMDPDDVAQEGLDHLKDGPTWFPGETNRAFARALCTPDRRAATELMSTATSSVKPAQ
jgi:short-subunit dehydrogenase